MKPLACVGYRRQHRAALLGDGVGAQRLALEVMPEHVFADPDALLPLAERYPIAFHSVVLSPGTAGPHDGCARERLGRVAALARRVRPRFVSDHLALTHAPNGIDLGHLMPLTLTRAALDIVATAVSRIQDACAVPCLVENIAWPFVLPGDYEEGPFLAELVARTGCGVLLDLTNLLYNGRNFGFDPRAALATYPLGALRAVHLAGGFQAEGHWVDSHTRPVDEDALALLPMLRGKAPVELVTVERDDALPALETLVAEAQRAVAAFEPVVGGDSP